MIPHYELRVGGQCYSVNNQLFDDYVELFSAFGAVLQIRLGTGGPVDPFAQILSGDRFVNVPSRTVQNGQRVANIWESEVNTIDPVTIYGIQMVVYVTDTQTALISEAIFDDPIVIDGNQTVGVRYFLETQLINANTNLPDDEFDDEVLSVKLIAVNGTVRETAYRLLGPLPAPISGEGFLIIDVQHEALSLITGVPIPNASGYTIRQTFGAVQPGDKWIADTGAGCLLFEFGSIQFGARLFSYDLNVGRTS